MERNKFKVGDLIRGNAKADKYRWTTVGWEGRVINIISENIIKVEGLMGGTDYNVHSECFDLITAAQPSEPSYDIY